MRAVSSLLLLAVSVASSTADSQVQCNLALNYDACLKIPTCNWCSYTEPTGIQVNYCTPSSCNQASTAAAAIATTTTAKTTTKKATTATKAVVEPFPMSDVTLHGEYAEMEARNQEVLLSLNFSQWACHFTTAANLTKCETASEPWHAFVKQEANASSSASPTYVHEMGFLQAGDDVKPAEDVR